MALLSTRPPGEQGVTKRHLPGCVQSTALHAGCSLKGKGLYLKLVNFRANGANRGGERTEEGSAPVCGGKGSRSSLYRHKPRRQQPPHYYVDARMSFGAPYSTRRHVTRARSSPFATPSCHGLGATTELIYTRWATASMSWARCHDRTRLHALGHATG